VSKQQKVNARSWGPLTAIISVWIPANLYTGSTQWGAIPPTYLNAISGVNHPVGTSRYDVSKFVTTIPVGGTFLGPRAGLRKGGMQNWDVSLFKNISLGANEARQLQLRFEAFNVFNHPNFEKVTVWCGCWMVRP